MNKKFNFSILIFIFLCWHNAAAAGSPVDIPCAEVPGNGIFEIGGAAGFYEPPGNEEISNEKDMWGRFGLFGRLEAEAVLFQNEKIAGNAKLLILKENALPALAVGIRNITGKTKESFTTGLPGEVRISNTVYGVISKKFNLGSGIGITVVLGRGNRSFIAEGPDFKDLNGTFAGIDVAIKSAKFAVEEDGRDINASVTYNFPTGASAGFGCANLTENESLREYKVFISFSNQAIEDRLARLENEIYKAPASAEKKEPEPVKAQITKLPKKAKMKKHFMKGYNLFTQKKYAESIEWFEKVLEIDPEHSESKNYIKQSSIKIRFMTGYELFTQKKFRESIVWFEKVLEIDPDHPESKTYLKSAKKKDYFLTGHRLVAQKNFTEAIEWFKKVLEIDPDHPESEKYLNLAKKKMCFTRGYELFTQQKYRESIVWFKKVLEVSPGHVESENYIKRAEEKLK
ncbi:MAG: tetratricopeptide repeat protein [bacterium]